MKIKCISKTNQNTGSTKSIYANNAIINAKRPALVDLINNSIAGCFSSKIGLPLRINIKIIHNIRAIIEGINPSWWVNNLVNFITLSLLAYK